MLVTQLFQTRFARASAIDQMLDDQLSGSFDSQLRQGHYCAQQFANIRYRQLRINACWRKQQGCKYTMADKNRSSGAGPGPGSTLTAASSIGPAGRRGGLLERAITRLLMRPAPVSEVADLSERFRLIDFQGDALKGCAWSPGDKVQMKLDGGLSARTYTPIGWDRQAGRTQCLVYCHGAGPGSEWARHVTPGDERQFFGPRGSLALGDIDSPTVLFGDETSFALTLAFERHGRPGTNRRFVFEVNDRKESAAVLRALGLSAPILVERRQDASHLAKVSDVVLADAAVQPMTIYVLSGKATSIQYVNRALKARGIDSGRLRTKAY